MQTIKTSELTGSALDWAVAKCGGFEIAFDVDEGDFWLLRTDHSKQYFPAFGYLSECFHPSSDWAQGGPIIERLGFSRIVTNISEGYTVSKKLVTLTDDDELIYWVHGVGENILIAAMRCYVASKMGDTVEIPKELL